MSTHPRGAIAALLAALLAGICLAGVLAPAAGARRSASAPAGSAAPLGGVNVDGPDRRGAPLAAADSEIASAQALHAKLVRVVVAWSALQPGGPGEVDAGALSYLDRLVSDASTDRIGVILTVDSTPCWDSSAPAEVRAGCHGGESSPANRWPPSEPSAYAAFVALLAQRYGSALSAVEVWNEPDQVDEEFFAGPNKAVRYAALVRATYPAVKRVNPRVTVLAGSLVGYNGVFLRALYAAGMKGYYDALSVHFYSLTLASLRSFRAVELANGDHSRLWLDEFGWDSCYPTPVQFEQACVTEPVQALNIRNIFRELRGTNYVAAMTLYELHDSPADNFGVIGLNGLDKPSFGALAEVLKSPAGAASPVTLSLSRAGSSVLARGSAPVGDYMHLEVKVGGLVRYRALFTLDRFNSYAITLPSALGTHGLRVRVYQQWLGPKHSATKSI